MSLKSQTCASPSIALKRSSRIESIGVSGILRIAAQTRQLKSQGRRIIDLSAGEPDFDTPEHIKEAARRALDNGETKYTALDGTPALKDAVRRKFASDNGLDFEHEEIFAGAGAKQILFNAFMATLDPGDEVILPTPCWLSYFDIIRIAGGKPVLVPCQESTEFKLVPQDLARAISPRTRWVLLNSPSNPTGATYTRNELAGLLEIVAAVPQIWVISDDIYEHIVYDDGPYATPAAVRPDLRNRILTVNGVSKAYAMTGWRLGYAGAPRDLVRAMAVVQSQSTSNPCSISQAAAIAALDGPQDIVAQRREIFRRRRDFLVHRIRGINGLTSNIPGGAFYLFVSCKGLIGARRPNGTELSDDNAVCSYLLETADVSAVPGSGFGTSDHIRLSFATGTAALQEACNNIERACADLTH